MWGYMVNCTLESINIQLELQTFICLLVKTSLGPHCDGRAMPGVGDSMVDSHLLKGLSISLLEPLQLGCAVFLRLRSLGTRHYK